MALPANDIDTCASTGPTDLGGENSAEGEHPAVADPLLSAPILAALERAWAAIRARHVDLPPVVMVLASGSDGAPAGWLKLGHFAAMRWQTRDDVMPEVFIGGEGLARGAAAVLGTLLHEAAHALAHTRGIKDTSRQGRYHNQRYADLARALGLDVAQIAPIGWSHTTLTEATTADYQATLDDLTQALTIFRRSESDLFTTTTGPDDDIDGLGDGLGGGDATRSPRPPAGPARPSRSLAAVRMRSANPAGPQRLRDRRDHLRALPDPVHHHRLTTPARIRTPDSAAGGSDAHRPHHPRTGQH